MERSRWSWDFLELATSHRSTACSRDSRFTSHTACSSSQIVSQCVRVCSCVHACVRARVHACPCACVGLRTCIRIPCLLCGSQLICLRPSIDWRISWHQKVLRYSLFFISCPKTFFPDITDQKHVLCMVWMVLLVS